MYNREENIPLIIISNIYNQNNQDINKRNFINENYNEEKINKFIKYFGITILILLTISFFTIVIIQSIK
jgi:hypothetical protein